MRTQLTDQKCAELAANFKPFTVRRRYDSPLSGLNYSKNYHVASIRKNALHIWVIKLKGSDIDYIAENFELYEKPKEAPKPIAHKPTDQKSFDTHPVQSKNIETDRLIKYVSTHKYSMSSDSINHFARLIGLIKLGEI